MPKTKNQNLKAVIYARYSSHAQNEQSIEGQLRDDHEWAEREGVTVIGEYIDRALTGTKDNRPDFQRMIEDAAKKQFSLVIVWKLDRFARNRYDSAIYKSKLKKFGVKVVSVKENITDSPEGIILEGLLESMAEYYSANLSQNVMRGMRETVEKGFFPGGTVPYGYKIKDRRLVPDERTAPFVRYAFEHYAAGDDMRSIVDALNARGARNARGNLLTYTSFHRAFRNPVYIGEYTYNGEVVEGCAEPLVTREVFTKAVSRLDERKRAPAAAKARIPYLLQGRVYCGLCGASMIGESGRSHTGNIYSYYSCYNRKRNRTCDKSNERRDSLDTFVVAQTMEYVLTPSRMKRIAAAVVKEYNKEFSSSSVNEFEKELSRVDREYEKLIDALIDAPKAAHKRIYERMEQLEAQKAELESEAAKARVAMSLTLTEKEVLSWLHTFSEGDPSDNDFRSRLISTFINSVYVYEDRIVIFYNIKGLSPSKTSTDKDQLATLETSSAKDGLAALETYNPDSTSDNNPGEKQKPEPSGSDLLASGDLSAYKSEPRYIFVSGVFGCIFPRHRA